MTLLAKSALFSLGVPRPSLATLVTEPVRISFIPPRIEHPTLKGLEISAT
jgi:hypothetical protein